jgi:hypothetical protein
MGQALAVEIRGAHRRLDGVVIAYSGECTSDAPHRWKVKLWLEGDPQEVELCELAGVLPDAAASPEKIRMLVAHEIVRRMRMDPI